MTLKTSSRKINPFWNMIGFTLRKNIGIIIVLCIAALLYCPGSFIVNYEDLLVSVQNNRNNYLIENFGNAVTVLSAIIAVLFNMLNFSFLYKKSSSDVFHSFPLTRSELLLSRLLSGITATLIPTLICYTSLGILMAFNGWMGTFTELFWYLLHTVIIMLVCSSFSMVFVVCAGGEFDLCISLIGGNLALIAVGWIFESILSETLIGFSGYYTSEIMYNLSPPYACGVGLGLANDIAKYGINGKSIEFLIRSVAYIVAFTVASLLLYNRRKAEKGGTAYAYKFMFLGCSLLAGICGGFLLGMIFIGNITNFAFWFFAVVGSVLTAVVYGTITNRGFKGIWRSVIMGGISAVVLISVAISGVTGGFGYTNRIPDSSKIKNVTVSAFDENIIFYEPQQALDLHKAILDTNAIDFNYSVPYYQRQTIRFYYELQNGSTMQREFTVVEPKVSDELLKIYKSEDRLKMINEHIDIVNAEQFSLYFYHNDEYYNVNISKSEADEFIKIYWQDVQNSDASVFEEKDYRFIELSGYRKRDAQRDDYFQFQFEWQSSFTNTNQFIESHNLIERAKEQQQQNEAYEKY